MLYEHTGNTFWLIYHGCGNCTLIILICTTAGHYVYYVPFQTIETRHLILISCPLSVNIVNVEAVAWGLMYERFTCVINRTFNRLKRSSSVVKGIMWEENVNLFNRGNQIILTKSPGKRQNWFSVSEKLLSPVLPPETQHLQCLLMYYWHMIGIYSVK